MSEMNCNEKRKNENFPVASVLMPPKVRKSVMAFYHFARSADDIADELSVPFEEKLSLLHAADDAIANDNECVPVWAADYMSLIRNGELDNRHGRALLSAFTQDVEKKRYDSWDDLIDYCMRSAAPVGRAVLELHGQWNADIQASDDICNVLQILNHLQDLKSDFLERDRIYFPVEWFDDVNDLAADKSNANIQQIIIRSLNTCDEMLESAKHLPSTLTSKRLRAEIATIWHIADKLSQKLRVNDPLAKKVKLTKWEYVQACLKGGWTALVSGRHIVGSAEVTSKSGSSFFRPLLSLSKEKQQAMFALYAFCRVVDDAVDEAENHTEAEKNISFWENDLALLYSQEIVDYPTHPVTRSLLPWIKKYQLNRTYFDEILQGMRMDLDGMVKPSQKDFSLYCYRVASCVGQLSVQIFGEDNEVGHEFANALGESLQTINIMRDVFEDATYDRIYLPRELLKKHHIADMSVQDVLDANPNYLQPLQKVLEEMGVNAKARMDEAFSLLDTKNGANLKPAILMAKVYLAYMDKIERSGYQVSSERIRLSKLEKMRLISS